MLTGRFLFFLSTLLHLCNRLASNPISYAGMEIECPYDCGDLDSDPNMNLIEKIFSEIVGSTVSLCSVLDDSLQGTIIDPWKSDFDSYFVWDWKTANGIWHENGPFLEYSALSYRKFLETSQALREDLAFYSLKAPILKLNKYKWVLSQLKSVDPEEYQYVEISNGQIEFSTWTTAYSTPISEAIENYEYRICQEDKYLPDCEVEYEKKKEAADKALSEIDSLYQQIFLWCLREHQPEGIAFHSALEHFIAQDFGTAIAQLHFLAHLAENNDLLSKLYLLQGQLESEHALYGDAVIDLTKAIEKDPSLKEAYFERAAAYFELGEFDKALSDYLESGFKPAEPTVLPQLCTGIALGILDGGISSAAEFIPEVLGTLRGLGKGLWAFAGNPVHATQELAASALQCIQLLKKHSPLEFIQDMIPELKNLLQNFNGLNDFDKGKQIGAIIGKYGTDVLLCKHSFTAIKAYRELKKANQLMTLEALASPARSKALIEESKKVWALRENILRSSNLEIHMGRQGKHLIGHNSYEIRLNRSIFEHSDPTRLIKKYAGTGIRETSHPPGSPGYKEIVNFEEFIGFDVHPITGIKTPTTRGKIHYSKDGVHIVPTKPK